MGLLDLDGDTGNFLSQLLTSTGSMTPGFMQPQQRPSYSNVLNSAAQTAVDPIFGPGYRGMQPGTGTGPSYEDIQRQAYQGAGAPTGGEAPRRRSSVVDILGTFADAFAELGGEKGSYQSRLDAQRERERQAEADQMAREEFGLNKQKLGLETRKTEMDLRNEQNEVLGRASRVLAHALQTQGPQGALTIFGELGTRLGMSPQELQQEAARFQANPEGYIQAMSAFADAEGGTEAGLNLVYGEDEHGNVVAFQPVKGGGLYKVDPGPGIKLTPGVTVMDLGDRKEVIQNRGGRTVRSEVVVGGPEKGELPIVDDDGNVIGYRVAPGSKTEREATDPIDQTAAKYDAALAGLDPIDGYVKDLDASLEALKDVGSMTGVDDQTWLGNLRALGYQNIPGVERVFNSTGGSARATVDSITTNLATNFMNAMKKATDEGASSSARMQDTEKEVQRLKESVTNAKDYNSAKAALSRFQNYVASQRAYLVEQRQRQAAKRERITRGGQQPSAPSGGNRIRYDAQGNRIQ